MPAIIIGHIGDKWNKQNEQNVPAAINFVPIVLTDFFTNVITNDNNKAQIANCMPSNAYFIQGWSENWVSIPATLKIIIKGAQMIPKTETIAPKMPARWKPVKAEKLMAKLVIFLPRYF